jgi:hypothetical protein
MTNVSTPSLSAYAQLNNGEALTNKPLAKMPGANVSGVNSAHQFKVGEMHGTSNELGVPHQ